MNNRSVSVVIPMYNSENTIARCIRSVINQTYNGYVEIIVVDDGSKDKSFKISSNLKIEHANVDIKIIQQINKGVSSARNRALVVAQGDYIAFLDSDDEWSCDKLEKQLKVFEEYPDAYLVGTTFNGMSFNRFFLKKFYSVTLISLCNLLFKNFFQPSTVIIKREILNTIGLFDESQRYAEEGNYFLRIASKYKCYLLNESLLNFGDGKIGFGHSGLSANINAMERGELKNLLFAYRSGYVSFFVFLIAIAYSLVKYFRRLLITQFK